MKGLETMVKLTKFGKDITALDYSIVIARQEEIASMIDERSGKGNDFLGWLDYVSKLDEEEVHRIQRCAERLRKNYDCLVVVGIGGSYLGARAAIDALKGLYSGDPFEIIYMGNTLSSTYTAQVLKHLEGKRFAINVISKSGTTTEPSVAFRLLKEMLVKNFGEEYLKDAIVATTDRARGALKKEADEAGYEQFVIPDDVGGRYSVITPVGLLPIACANIDIKAFLNGVKDGEKEYSTSQNKLQEILNNEVAECSMGSSKDTPVDLLLKKELYSISKETCKGLDDVERKIIEKIYLQGEQVVNVAKELGYSRCHISRMKRSVLEGLEKAINKKLDYESNDSILRAS